MKSIIIFFFLLFFSQNFAQGEGNIWYFGNNAGLDFNSGVPVVLTNGQLNTVEGCATISDSNGQLLFYTDGVTVYNKNHQIMPNGTNLKGHFSSSQSAIIVPKPGSPAIYYIFTCTDIANPDGVRYSEVDMTLNGGLGDVTAHKNILLFAPACEKLAAVKNAAEDGYWMVGHEYGTNNFRSYSITATGVNMTPVISSVGISIDNNIYKTLGYLKFSLDGSKLISCNRNVNVELFNFSTATGVVSNPKLITPKIGSYGVEFSPSGELAYISTGTDYTTSLQLYQFDLTASDIPNSALLLYEMGIEDVDYIFGALQLAADGKIYVARNKKPALSVIQNPDVLGTGCNLQMESLFLGGALSQNGLPQFMQSYFNLGIAFENNCQGQATTFSLMANQSITSALWDFGDGNASTDIHPIHTYTSPGTYTVTLDAIGTNGAISKSRQVTIYAMPIANTVANQVVCGTEGMAYSLSQHTNTILGGQSSTVFGVSYFLSPSDADDNMSPLTGSYNLPLGITTIYARVQNMANTSCYSITSFTIHLFKQPQANQPSDYVICESQPYDNKEQFDLLSKNNEILNGQNALEFTISYHDSQADADAGIDDLPLLYTNTNAIEPVYARIENNLNPDCFDIVTFPLKVVQQPIIVPVTAFRMCDDATNDGTAIFDLTDKTAELLDGQSPSVFEVKYFLSYPQAVDGTDAIMVPITNSSNNQTIYYSITAIGNSNCKAIGSFNLKVDRLPIANSANRLAVCDDDSNDGKFVFNLQDNYNSILGNQLTSEIRLTYHESQINADGRILPLSFNYENATNPQVIYVRVENAENSQCFSTTSFEIRADRLPKAYPVPDMITCDGTENDGKESFDLTVNNPSVLNGQSAALFAVSYHTTWANAQNNAAPLQDDFMNTTNPQTLYARVSNRDNSACYDITSFDLWVREKPDLTLQDTYSICEGVPKKLTADAGFDRYEWSTGATSPSIMVPTAGNYWVRVTKDYGDIICETVKNITVVNSNVATIVSVETSDWTSSQNAILVLVEGDGDYEYSIDGEHYQDSPQFNGLNNGVYTVYVRDKNECGIAKEQVYLLMYPKFFTPNGDGYNDKWQIDFSSYEPTLKVNVFDRYGKFIISLNGGSDGWDGTYNGQLLLSDDYWFVAKREDGKEFRGHFSLKR
ncbi:T9SS type B sorting domain-containing protein [Flavobacterium sp. PLA-1-15]|uniref:T9SS type B sorting domain-containing protein n=1 Tax=Flavobacterium sp. PLA-1-15 TaxID=3380533 RepID=UPI003B7F3612